MIFRRPWPTIVLMVAILSFACFPLSASADIVVTQALTKATVSDQVSNYDEDESANLAGDTVTATFPGFSSTTTSVFTSAGLSNTFNQSRLGDLFVNGTGLTEVHFTANANDAYSINGSFISSDGWSLLGVHLYDFTASSFVFQNEQGSYGGGTFTVGGVAGNQWNLLSGSQAGWLVAGHQYRWQTQSWTQAYPAADGGATASGLVSLQIGSVPEPTGVEIVGVALLFGIVLVRLGRISYL